MIVQAFLNWLSSVVAALLDPLPNLPTEISTLVTRGQEAVAQFAGTAATLGPIVPYNALNAMGVTFVAVVGYWGVVLLVRIVAWGLGR